MQPPIILAAFGTTTKALAAYASIEASIQSRFPNHEIHWAYSSRIIRNSLKNNQSISLPDPAEVLQALYERGHRWAVVQSLHFLAGHEFYRLVQDIQPHPLRTSVGLPVLTAEQDYIDFCNGLSQTVDSHKDHAVILAGHGTDHPAWSGYPALLYYLRNRFGHQIYLGLLEGSPAPADVLAELQANGISKALLVPMLLVAGRHFQNELTGPDPDSWKSLLTQANITCKTVEHGMGEQSWLCDILCRHIDDALDAIP